METLNKILEDRGSDYGDFEAMAHTAQEMKELMKLGRAELSNAQQEAIDMICTKMSRLAWGNPNKLDTWQDIAGYATLIVNILEKEKFQR